MGLNANVPGADRDQLARLIRKLRADCVYLGADEYSVSRMRLEELMECRRRRLRFLSETAPQGAKWDA